MPFIRLSDNYIDHPKFLALSDGAFRLWHESMAFCRKHQTDGLIPFSTMRGFRYYTKSREKQLATGYIPEAKPLWILVRSVGYTINDYLFWNLSKEEESCERSAATARMRKFRSKQKDGIGDGVRDGVGDASHRESRTPFVQDMEKDLDLELGSSSEKRRVEKQDSDDLGLRAGRLLQEDYPRWYAEERHGARLRIVANSLTFQDALSVVEQWDDAHIEKLARIVLTTDDDWISHTDRSFKIFALKASWADDRLRQWEAKQAVSV